MGIQAHTPEPTPHTAIFPSASIMCQVTSFFCGCADLRKGALIIGIVKLVMSILQVVWTVLAVFVFAVFTGSATVGAFANARPPRTMALAMAVATTERCVTPTPTEYLPVRLLLQCW